MQECMLQTLDPTSRLFARSLLTCDSAMSARSSASSRSCCNLRNFPSDLFSLIQTVLQVFDGLLHILLHALQVSTGVLLFLQLLCHHGRINLSCFWASAACLLRALEGVNHSLQVSLALLHLFIFLRNFTLHVCLNLVELKLSSKNLTFLVL
uniref:Uncharacterized protein n=1 Tax=Neogobius melanostomus TaxID=47308 RepID=A0A8C6V9Q5_9GOBI